MSKTVIDGIVKDWGERLHYSPVKGSKGRNIRSGGPTRAAKPAPPSGPATKEKVARTAKKTAEVMVKISGGGKNMKHIKAHMDYISRNGDVEIEDENGDRKPLILAYAFNGYPLVDSESHEGYTGLAGNTDGPLRVVAETNQGASVKYANKLVVTIPGSGKINITVDKSIFSGGN